MIGAKRTRTPAVLQLEAVECGAAALAAVLGFYNALCRLLNFGVNAVCLEMAARHRTL